MTAPVSAGPAPSPPGSPRPPAPPPREPRGPLARLLAAVAAHPVLSLLLCAAAVAVPAAAGSGLRPDNGLAVWFVDDDPVLRRYREFGREFGSDESVAIVYPAPGHPFAPAERALQRAAAERVAAVEGIDLVVDPGALYEAAEGDSAGMDLVSRFGLLGPDGRTVTLLARMSARPDVDAVRAEVLDSVRAGVEETLGRAGRPARLAGVGVLYDALNRQTLRDSGIYLGLAVAVMTALLFFLLRRATAVAVALAPPLGAAVATLGIYALSGRPFTQVTAILPTLVLVIGLSDAVHLVSRYREERGDGPPPPPEERRRLAARAAAWVAIPNLFTALTTAAGFAALATSKMAAIRDLGLAAAAAMLVGWALTLVVGTAALALRDLPPPPPARRDGPMDRFVSWLATHVPRRPGVVLGGVAAALAVFLLGASRVKVDTYTLELLPDGHPVREDSRWIERHAGYYTPLEFVVRATGPDGALDAQVLRRVEAWQRAAESRGDVGRTFGFADLAALAGTEDPEVYEGWLSADGREGRVTVYVPMTSTRGFTEVGGALAAEGERVLGGAAELRPAGYLPLYLRIVDYVVQGTLWGLATSTLVVFAMIGLLLRSVRLTLAAVPTNLFPVALVFGIMGWTGIPLDIATATIGAIVLGISVDDTIHFLFRYRDERRAGRDRAGAVRVTFRATGRAVIQASVVLALGFAVLSVSGSASIAAFGVVSAVSIVGAMLADLFLLPVLLVGGASAEGEGAP